MNPAASDRWTVWICRGAAAGLIVAWVTTRLGWVQYYVLAGLYWLLEQAGWMDTTKGLGGQVAGYNYWREPIWLRQIANLMRDWMVLVPLLLMVWFLWERRGAGWRKMVWRAGALSAWAAATVHWAMLLIDVDAVLRQKVFLKIGEALGGQVIYIGVMVSGPNGPFVGEDWRSVIFNAMYRYGPELVMLAIAAAVTVAGARLLVRCGVVKCRDASECESCGYSLVGVPGVVCPECGNTRG